MKYEVRSLSRRIANRLKREGVIASRIGELHNGRRIISFSHYGKKCRQFFRVSCLNCDNEAVVAYYSIKSGGCAECHKKALHNIPDKRVDNRGYVWLKVPGHPMANRNGWCLEHRLVMANHLGRNLMPYEDVHHIRSWEKGNNDISNLELWCRKHPAGSRVEDVVAFSKEMLALYEPGVLAQ